jgi:hypothetical protein
MTKPVNIQNASGSDTPRGQVRPVQPSLFDYQALDLVSAIKCALNEALHESTLSREQVVDEVNRQAERAGFGSKKPLTLPILDKWCAPAALDYLPSLRYLPVLCRVLDDLRPLEALVRACGGRLVDDRDWLVLDWAKKDLAAKEAARAAKKAKESL